MRLEDLKTDFDRRVAQQGDAAVAWGALWESFVEQLNQSINDDRVVSETASFAYTKPPPGSDRLIVSLTRWIDIDASAMPEAENEVVAQLVVSAFWETIPNELRDADSVGVTGAGDRPSMTAELSREDFVKSVEALPISSQLRAAPADRWSSHYVPPSELD